jgi:hypothetical protein
MKQKQTSLHSLHKVMDATRRYHREHRISQCTRSGALSAVALRAERNEARAAIKCPHDLSDENIARAIIELANAGERNVEVLCEAALNATAGAVSAPNPPPLPASPPSKPDSSF